jgi:predicted O-methyltransferase YrrM
VVVAVTVLGIVAAGIPFSSADPALVILLALVLGGVLINMCLQAENYRTIRVDMTRQLTDQRHAVSKSFQETIQRSQKKILDMNAKHSRDLYIQLEALHNLQQKIDLEKPLPSLTGGAASPELALSIVDAVEESSAKTVVDIGSGISSAVAGYAVSKISGGRVLALDHAEEFYEKTKRLVEEHELSSTVEVVHAPLTEYELENGAYQWYERKQLEAVDSIDVLVVDGPPGFVHASARYPALPLLHEKLSPHAIVIMDDYKRDDEKAIVDKWTSDYPEFELEVIDSRKGIAVLRRGDDVPSQQ